jgi:hypothetical protein
MNTEDYRIYTDTASGKAPHTRNRKVHNCLTRMNTKDCRIYTDAASGKLRAP